MAKKILLSIALFLGGLVAQESKKNLLHLGLIGGDAPSFGLGLQYHYRMHDQFSIGVAAGLGFNDVLRGGLFVFSFKNSLQLDYHFAQLAKLPSEWDLYAGVQGGTVLYARRGIALTGHGGVRAGMRYFVKPSVGLQAEVSGGYLSNGLQIGVVWRL